MISDRSTFLILRELALGSLRPVEVEERLPLLGHATVSRRLRQLATAGVVERRASTGVPRQVWYELSRDGRQLAGAVLVAVLWEANALPRPAEPSTADAERLVHVAAPIAAPRCTDVGLCRLRIGDGGRSAVELCLEIAPGQIDVATGPGRREASVSIHGTPLECCRAIASGRLCSVAVDEGDRGLAQLAVAALHAALFPAPRATTVSVL